MNRILIRPVKRLFSKRQQWVFEIRGANGERIDPRDTVFNRGELALTLSSLFVDDPLEMVLYDRHGNVERRETLRK